jgi:hypothetical protein
MSSGPVGMQYTSGSVQDSLSNTTMVEALLYLNVILAFAAILYILKAFKYISLVEKFQRKVARMEKGQQEVELMKVALKRKAAELNARLKSKEFIGKDLSPLKQQKVDKLIRSKRFFEFSNVS